MKEIIAIVRMNKMNKTKRALAEAGIAPSPPGMRWARKGIWWICNYSKGAEHGYEEAIAQLGQSQRLIPKRALLIVWCPTNWWRRRSKPSSGSTRPANPATARSLSCPVGNAVPGAHR